MWYVFTEYVPKYGAVRDVRVYLSLSICYDYDGMILNVMEYQVRR